LNCKKRAGIREKKRKKEDWEGKKKLSKEETTTRGERGSMRTT